MRSVLIGGIGNVLLGDDGVGPCVARLLDEMYSFGDQAEIVDLGTPALDLTHQIASRPAVILVDCVASDEHAAGTVILYRKEDILRVTPAQRLDPHSSALSECLMTAELLGQSPDRVLLVGIVGKNFEPDCALSLEVRHAVQKAIETVLTELEALGVQPIPNTSRCVANVPAGSAKTIWESRTGSGKIDVEVDTLSV